MLDAQLLSSGEEDDSGTKCKKRRVNGSTSEDGEVRRASSHRLSSNPMVFTQTAEQVREKDHKLKSNAFDYSTTKEPNSGK